MDDPYAVDRRGFLKTGAVAAAATAVACGKADSPWRALSVAEADTLAAACDRIIPPDQDPGATQAGVVTFIDRQLATRQKRDARILAPGHRRPRRERAAPARAGASPSSPRTRRSPLLQEIEQGTGDKADWGEVEPGGFFSRLRNVHDDGLLRRPAARRQQGPRRVGDARRARPAGSRTAARDAAAPGARAARGRGAAGRGDARPPRKRVSAMALPRVNAVVVGLGRGRRCRRLRAGRGRPQRRAAREGPLAVAVRGEEGRPRQPARTRASESPTGPTRTRTHACSSTSRAASASSTRATASTSRTRAASAAAP